MRSLSRAEICISRGFGYHRRLTYPRQCCFLFELVLRSIAAPFESFMVGAIGAYPFKREYRQAGELP